MADQAVGVVPPFLLVALRYLIVAVVFLPFTRRGNLRWVHIVSVGWLYGVVQFSGLFLGLRLGVGAGVAATVIQSQVLFTIVLARLLLKEPVRLVQWAELALGTGGLFLIASSGGGGAPVRGIACVLVGAAGWAASNIVLKTAGPVSAWSLTVWQSVAVVPVMPLLSVAFETNQVHVVTHLSPRTTAALCYIALCSTGLGNFVWYRLVQRVGPSRAAPFSLLVPVVGLLAARVVLDQRLSSQQAAGMLLTVLGTALVMRPTSHAPRRSLPSTPGGGQQRGATVPDRSTSR